MGKLINVFFGIILIALGVNYWFNFLSFIPSPYGIILPSAILLVMGYLIIRSSKVVLPNGEKRRKLGLILMGILIALLGIIQIINMIGYSIPYTEFFVSGTIPAIILIILGIILVLLIFQRKQFEMYSDV